MDAKVLLVAGILVVAAVGGVAAYKFIIDPDPDHTPTLTEFKGNEVVSLNTYKSSPGMTINDPGHLVKGMDYTETQSCMIFHISNINDWFLGAIDVTDGDGTTATFSQSNSKTLSKSISNQVMRGISNSSTIGNENTQSYSLTTQSGFEFTEGGSLSASVTAGVEKQAPVFGVSASVSATVGAEQNWATTLSSAISNENGISTSVSRSNTVENYSEYAKAMTDEVSDTLGNEKSKTFPTESGKYYCWAAIKNVEVYEYVNMEWDGVKFVFKSVGFVVVTDEDEKIRDRVYVSDQPFTQAHINDYFKSNNSKSLLTDAQIEDAVALFNTTHTTAPSGGNDVNAPENEEVIIHKGENNDDWDGYTKIYTAADFKNVSTMGNYVLMNDINLGSWSPIYEFSGTLNGNNYSISYLCNKTPVEHKNGSYTETYAGLFGKLNGATIKNLKVQCNINVPKLSTTGSYSYLHIGGIAGSAHSGTTIENCTVSGTIAVANWQNICVEAGGVIGVISDASGLAISVKKCTNLANLTVQGEYFVSVGGITGVVSTNSDLSDLNNYGDVKGKSHSGLIIASERNSKCHLYVGGVIGRDVSHGLLERINLNNFGTYNSYDTNTTSVYKNEIIGHIEP